MAFIVVGVDGSATSLAALREAVTQAKVRDARVHAVNVVTVPTLNGYEFGPFDIDQLRDAGQKTVDEAIATVAHEYGGKFPVEITSDVPTGHVGIELLRAAKADGGADLVVTGSRGLGGFSSLLLGSVTTYLAHHLTSPLLIIPTVDQD